MKRFATTCLAVALLGSAVNAEELFYEGFSYNPSVLLGDPWVQADTGGDNDNDIYTTDAGLEFGGTSVEGVAATNEYRFAEVKNSTLSGSPMYAGSGKTETLYMSYLLRFDSEGGWGENFTVGITNSGSGNIDGFHVGLFKSSGDTFFGAAIGRTNTADATFGDDLTPGEQVYFMLAKCQWEGGPNYSDVTDGMTLSMSVFADALPDAEPTEWDLVHTEDKVHPFQNPTIGFDTVVIKAGNTSTVATADEIRVGTLYDDVIPPSAFLAGDANGDGQVDGNDLISVEENFGDVGDPGISGDANGDGQVDGNDLISVEENFGNTSGAASVPEPASLLLLGLCGAALTRMRR